MIKTLTGEEVVIISGSEKSITGTKPFLVRFVRDQIPQRSTYIFQRDKYIFPEKVSRHWNKPFKVQRHQLIYESIDELRAALNKKKAG